MVKIVQNFQRLVHNRMAFLAFDVGNKAHATGVMLITRIVQALKRRKSHLDDRPTSNKAMAKKAAARESPSRKSDENCAKCPHDCRKVILQPRKGIKRAVNAVNTVATWQKVRLRRVFLPESAARDVENYP
ncbi:hypothetical protein [Novosphingobium sp. THN1]|nr:hypothetical protein [Novosphingobium sp. THN1]